jgi:molybdopterin-containing oxidoreductase family iron-sulfur binding subunit
MSHRHDDSESEEGAPGVSELGLTRRTFGQAVLGALAGAALSGCDLQAPPEWIVPYVDRSPEIVPGVPLFFATGTEREGYGVGLVARSREGRPVKLEGNPLHPFSLGGTSAVEQAALWDLYDPDRLSTLKGPAGSSYAAFARGLAAATPPGGRGLHLLLPPTSSLLVADLLERLAILLPEASVRFDPSLAPVERWEGAATAFGGAYEVHRDLTKAEVVLAVGSDFLMEGPFALRASRELAARRAIRDPNDAMSRLYAVETPLTVTGAYADHRLAARDHDVSLFPAQLLRALARRGLEVPEALRVPLDAIPAPDEAQRPFLEALADDVLLHRGKAVVWVGDRRSAEAHVVGHALEALVGGEVVRLTPSPIVAAGVADFDLGGLLDALDAGAVDTLITFGTNPAFTLPAELRFEERMRRARRRVALASHRDETAAAATWVVPMAHFLERWDVLRAPDGTLTFVQPLIRPIAHGQTIDDLLGILVGDTTTGRDRVERFAERSRLGRAGLDAALRDGIVRGSAFRTQRATIDWGAVASAIQTLAETARAARRKAGIELHVLPDPRIGRGAEANNGWLRELPDPITKTVWDNAAILAPETAKRLDVEPGDVLALTHGGGSVELPAYVQIGQAEGTIVTWAGYGRREGGRLATRGGVDVGAMWSLDRSAPTMVHARRTGRHELVVVLQTHSLEHDEPIAIRADQAYYAAHPEFTEPYDETPPSLYPEQLPKTHQWAMAIDLSKCTGCSACVVACEVENNTPVVGKVQAARGRHMHWLRIDRYYSGEASNPDVSMQPMLCQHCEKAPCEYVCPTAATVHSSDGLNQMVYNRCVGTRFCQNNCPYKIRRFNYFDYNREVEPIETLRMNPEVTVRARGVMEKCTYCVQRLRAAEDHAHAEGREVIDGEVQTACQQACPTRAIEFGLMSDPRSEVGRWFANPRTYRVLNHLGTRPRTRYLARIDNPNPDLEP